MWGKKVINCEVCKKAHSITMDKILLTFEVKIWLILDKPVWLPETFQPRPSRCCWCGGNPHPGFRSVLPKLNDIGKSGGNSWRGRAYHRGLREYGSRGSGLGASKRCTYVVFLNPIYLLDLRKEKISRQQWASQALKVFFNYCENYLFKLVIVIGILKANTFNPSNGQVNARF